MSPIKGLSERRRMTRLGKIRLGIKVPNNSGNGDHPKATDYFVVPEEVAALYGETPTELPIMIPIEDDEFWCSQYYRRYSKTRGLVCKGDGVTCNRMVDTKTGDVAGRTTTEVYWKNEMPCAGRECPDYQGKKCQEVMNLQFILPDVPGLGIWQIDTGSINSILNINSAAAMVRAVYKRISFIPLLLTYEPCEVNNPDDGKKKTVRVLNLRVRGTMKELMIEAAKSASELLLPPPEEPEAMPEDGTHLEAVLAEAEEVWPGFDSKEGVVPPPEDEPRMNQAEIDEAKVVEVIEGKPTRDPSTIKTTTDLRKVLFDDFGLQPKDQMEKLGISSWSMLAITPAEAYSEVAKVFTPVGD